MSKQGHLGNAAVQDRLRSHIKEREGRIGIAIDTIMSHPEGRFALHYIIYTLLGLESLCLDLDQRRAALWEGRRWGAKVLMELVESSSAANVANMLSEARATLTKDNATAKSAVVTEEDTDADAP